MGKPSWRYKAKTVTGISGLTSLQSENCCIQMTHAPRFKHRNLNITYDYGNFISYMPQIWVYYEMHIQHKVTNYL